MFLTLRFDIYVDKQQTDFLNEGHESKTVIYSRFQDAHKGHACFQLMCFVCC